MGSAEVFVMTPSLCIFSLCAILFPLFPPTKADPESSSMSLFPWTNLCLGLGFLGSRPVTVGT